jgi:hypothetical protein
VVYLPRANQKPWYPVGLGAWSGRIVAQVESHRGPRPSCAFGWQRAHGLVTSRPDLAGPFPIEVVGADPTDVLARMS